MPPTADSLAPPSPPAEAGASGKILIIGIFTVALIGAGGSWWFRYSSTHQAAKFWGAETARLIRDAPIVRFSSFSTPIDNRPAKFNSPVDNFADEPQVIHDVTAARGLVHLRNALLENHNFNWPSQPTSPFMLWKHALIFSDNSTGRSVCVLFSPELKLVASMETNSTLSYEPMFSGVAEMFAEFESLPTLEPVTSSPSASPAR